LWVWRRRPRPRALTLSPTLDSTEKLADKRRTWPRASKSRRWLQPDPLILPESSVRKTGAVVIALPSALTTAPRRFRSSLVSPSSVPNTPQRRLDLIVPLATLTVSREVRPSIFTNRFAAEACRCGLRSICPSIRHTGRVFLSASQATPCQTSHGPASERGLGQLGCISYANSSLSAAAPGGEAGGWC
jgi:hypothetical protein